MERDLTPSPLELDLETFGAPPIERARTRGASPWALGAPSYVGGLWRDPVRFTGPGVCAPRVLQEWSGLVEVYLLRTTSNGRAQRWRQAADGTWELLAVWTSPGDQRAVVATFRDDTWTIDPGILASGMISVSMDVEGRDVTLGWIEEVAPREFAVFAVTAPLPPLLASATPRELYRVSFPSTGDLLKYLAMDGGLAVFTERRDRVDVAAIAARVTGGHRVLRYFTGRVGLPPFQGQQIVSTYRTSDPTVGISPDGRYRVLAWEEQLLVRAGGALERTHEVLIVQIEELGAAVRRSAPAVVRVAGASAWYFLGGDPCVCVTEGAVYLTCHVRYLEVEAGRVYMMGIPIAELWSDAPVWTPLTSDGEVVPLGAVEPGFLGSGWLANVDGTTVRSPSGPVEDLLAVVYERTERAIMDFRDHAVELVFVHARLDAGEFYISGRRSLADDEVLALPEVYQLAPTCLFGPGPVFALDGRRPGHGLLWGPGDLADGVPLSLRVDVFLFKARPNGYMQDWRDVALLHLTYEFDGGCVPRTLGWP